MHNRYLAIAAPSPRLCNQRMHLWRVTRCCMGCAWYIALGILCLHISATLSWATEARPRLMGTIEFKSTLKNLPNWLGVMQRNAKNPIFTPGSKLNPRTTWDALKASMQGKSQLEQLRAVNTFWNKWPYRQDISVYKMNDYWAAPYEFRKNSGDCEDYAIAKFYTLKELGFNPDDMRIVIVRETIRNLAHAVLAVYLGDEIYILDNLSASVLSHTKLRQYVPQYSVNETHRWAHVRPRPKN